MTHHHYHYVITFIVGINVHRIVRMGGIERILFESINLELTLKEIRNHKSSE